jgi:hypothetical protein
LRIRKHGRKVAIPRGDIACPVEAVKVWQEAAGISQGALFRRVWNKRAQRVGAQRLTARIVADIVKAGASRLALDPGNLGAHSLRSGLVTTAVKRGVNLLKICDQTGHKSGHPQGARGNVAWRAAVQWWPW